MTKIIKREMKNEKTNGENVHTKSGRAQPRRARAHHRDSPSSCLQDASVSDVGNWEPAFGVEAGRKDPAG